MNIINRNRELIDRLRNDAREQERLMHVCDSTVNAQEAADVLEELTNEMERREERTRAHMNGRLKPCPICGSRATRSVDPVDQIGKSRFSVYTDYHVKIRCTGFCGCKLEFNYIAPGWVKNPKSEAARQGALRWNRRV